MNVEDSDLSNWNDIMLWCLMFGEILQTSSFKERVVLSIHGEISSTAETRRLLQRVTIPCFTHFKIALLYPSWNFLMPSRNMLTFYLLCIPQFRSKDSAHDATVTDSLQTRYIDGWKMNLFFSCGMFGWWDHFAPQAFIKTGKNLISW